MLATQTNRLTATEETSPCLSREQEADELLLARIREGEEDARRELVEKYGGRMLAVARRFLRSEEDRADALQDAFLSAFRSLDNFAGHSALGTWLHRIMVNACLMKLRTQSRTRAARMEDLLPVFDETGHPLERWRSWDEQGLALLTRKETQAQVRACIDRLPHPYRTILLLRDIEELDTEQTARHLGISTALVKTRLHRARQALRTLLEPLVLGEDRE